MSKVHSSEPLLVGNVTITAMERVDRYVTSGNEGSFVFFSKRPVGVTVESPDGSWDFDFEDWNSEAEPGVD